jgi:hypothetical protein
MNDGHGATFGLHCTKSGVSASFTLFLPFLFDFCARCTPFGGALMAQVAFANKANHQ